MSRIPRWQKPLLIAILLGAAQATAGAERMRLEAGGESFAAYAAGPEDASAAVVMVHDWFGVSPYYLEVADRLAAVGIRVIAVDLYSGEAATTHQEAWRLMSALERDDASRKIDAALEALQVPGRRLATFGFSMGAPHALSAALRHGETVAATVLFYGDTVHDPQVLEALGGPVMLVMGTLDDPAGAVAFHEAMMAAGRDAEIHLYPGAHHAFAQPLFNAGDTYRPELAESAMDVTLDFLQRRLAGGE